MARTDAFSLKRRGISKRGSAFPLQRRGGASSGRGARAPCNYTGRYPLLWQCGRCWENSKRGARFPSNGAELANAGARSHSNGAEGASGGRGARAPCNNAERYPLLWQCGRCWENLKRGERFPSNGEELANAGARSHSNGAEVQAVGAGRVRRATMRGRYPLLWQCGRCWENSKRGARFPSNGEELANAGARSHSNGAGVQAVGAGRVCSPRRRRAFHRSTTAWRSRQRNLSKSPKSLYKLYKKTRLNIKISTNKISFPKTP